jgi:hypothetical protein
MGRRMDDGGPMTEDGGRMTEDGGWRTDVGGIAICIKRGLPY